MLWETPLVLTSNFSVPGVGIRNQAIDISWFGATSHFATLNRSILDFVGALGNSFFKKFNAPGVEIRKQHIEIN